ncbi:transient receptor potential cation channel subfamily V member 5-like isoform X1 [Branchiostoma floridae x Branchiostoma japonicum]
MTRLSMGGLFSRTPEQDPDYAWRRQNEEELTNPLYKFVNLKREGELLTVFVNEGEAGLRRYCKEQLEPYLYNGGNGKRIDKEEFVLWEAHQAAKGCAFVETRSEEDILDDWKEDKFNKLQDHEACWDLYRRGGVGETALHLCFLNNTHDFTKIAHVLLDMYPKLALDYYEGEEYYGESCLHIAIVHDALDSVKLLVEKCGADVNLRATGRFFLPEDQKKLNIMTKALMTTDYKGYAYYGEYPLAFAACFDSHEIYDFLLEKGADPNMPDSFGNTVLHMLVIHNKPSMYKYAMKHPSKPADPYVKNKEDLTPLTLACKIGRPDMFNTILELGSQEFWSYSNFTCSAYPLFSVDSITAQGDTDWKSALMILIDGRSEWTLPMLQGGVIGQLLEEKWKVFGRRTFGLQLLWLVLHLVFLSTAVYLRPDSLELMAGTTASDIARYITEILIVINAVVFLLLEVNEIRMVGFMGLLKNILNVPDKVLFMIGCVCIVLCIPMRFAKLVEAEDWLLGIAIIGSWFYIFFYCRGWTLTGPFVTMIYKMIAGDMARFGIIYCTFIITFAPAFWIMFRDKPTEKFDSEFGSLMTLFQMTLGEFDYPVFNLAEFPALAKLLFVVFMMLVPIMLLNMLIAMMSNTFQEVVDRSEREWRRQKAKIIVSLERSFSKSSLQQFRKDYSIQLRPDSAVHLPVEPGPHGLRALLVIKEEAMSRAKKKSGVVASWKMAMKRVLAKKLQQCSRVIGKHARDKLSLQAQSLQDNKGRKPQDKPNGFSLKNLDIHSHLHDIVEGAIEEQEEREEVEKEKKASGGESLNLQTFNVQVNRNNDDRDAVSCSSTASLIQVESAPEPRTATVTVLENEKKATVEGHINPAFEAEGNATEPKAKNISQEQ